jgi:hypothetical protein
VTDAGPRAPEPARSSPVAVDEDGGGAVGPGAAAGDGAPSPLEVALREWTATSSCSSYDYHPRGGIQSFWCHRPSRITLAAIRALAGTQVFASGPHKSSLDLDAPGAEFGHYSPAFVRWLGEKAGPSPRGSAAQKATQAAYDAHLRPLAEVFFRTYEKASRDKACFQREQAAYAALIAKKKVPKGYYERWFWFMNPFFCDASAPARKDSFYYDNGFDAGYDGNVTKTVVGFWLRRAIDGTMEPFAEGLKKLVASYEPELAAKPAKPADPAALNKAIAAGLKAASTCKDPKAPRATASVEISVAPNGSISARFPYAPLQATRAAPCAARAFAAERVPPFDGAPLKFNRTLRIK